MTTTRSEPIDVTHELDMLCRWGIRAAWHVSLLWGALVSLLSWTGGAQLATAVIRGLVSFVAFGLVGWGVNAVMAQAGNQGDNASREGEDAAGPSGEEVPDETAGKPVAAAGAPGVEPNASGSHPSLQREELDVTAGDGWGESDYLAEAAS